MTETLTQECDCWRSFTTTDWGITISEIAECSECRKQLDEQFDREFPKVESKTLNLW